MVLGSYLYHSTKPTLRKHPLRKYLCGFLAIQGVHCTQILDREADLGLTTRKTTRAQALEDHFSKCCEVTPVGRDLAHCPELLDILGPGFNALDLRIIKAVALMKYIRPVFCVHAGRKIILGRALDQSRKQRWSMLTCYYH